MTDCPDARREFLVFLADTSRLEFLRSCSDGGVGSVRNDARFGKEFLKHELPRFRRRGLVKQTDDAFVLTELGELILDEVEDLAKIARVSGKLGSFLSAVPNWEAYLPELDTIIDAEVVVDDGVFTDRTFEHLTEEFNDVNDLRLLNPSPNNQESVDEPEVQLSHALLRHFEPTDTSVTVWRAEPPIPFQVAVSPQCAALWTSRFQERYDDFAVLLIHDNDDFVSWARSWAKDHHVKNSE